MTKPAGRSTVAARLLSTMLVIVTALGSSTPALPVQAAASLTVTPLTWNIVGLDSNDVTTGPNHFPVGAQVCNTGDTAAANVKSAFTWTTSDAYINLRPGTNTSFSADGVNLSPAQCTDFYYEAEITRNSAAYDHTRRYTITASADGA